MRIVIDLQGAQTESRFRGIGRYSMSLVKSIVRNRGEHEIIIAVSCLFPDSIEPIRTAFDGLLPQEKIRVWYSPAPVCEWQPGNNWRRESAELIREAFLAGLEPDAILITSLFEGYAGDAVTSIGRFNKKIPTAVILYDLIPFLNPESYLLTQTQRDHYHRKIDSLKKADLLLTISESARCEAISALKLHEDRLVSISTAIGEQFRQVKLTDRRVSELQHQYNIQRNMIMYAPGGFDVRKNIDGLISAYALLSPEVRASHQLVIASKIDDRERANIQKIRKKKRLKESDLILTGYVPDDDLVDLYNLAALFVFPSKHEGFGMPALEAMACGALTIGSSTSSIPEVIGWSEALFDPLLPKSIAEKIIQGLTDDDFRSQLKYRGQEQVKKFTWDEVGKHAVSALESLNLSLTTLQVSDTNRGDDELLLGMLADIDSSIKPTDDDLYAVATAITFNTSRSRPRQLLVDISELVQRDAKSGIQRVVRSILQELLNSPLNGYKVNPIYFDGERYRYASCFVHKNFDISLQKETDDVAEFNQDDIYIAPDLNAHITNDIHLLHMHLQRIGVKMYYIVYDILLIQHPEWWPEGGGDVFAAWLRNISHSATGLICISETVAEDVREWLENNPPSRPKKPRVTFFHLGADIEHSIPSKGIDEDSQATLCSIDATPSFLMVGTIEPRKGHVQALDAFEQLWKDGIDVNLVIVGSQGWMVETLVERLREHTELGKRLFWLEGISDEYLEKIYAASTCLIAASEGEGFGLPLIEGAQHELPIIARDIPVFREVAGEHAYYFSGADPIELVTAISHWMLLYDNKNHPISTCIPWLTWKKSVAQLMRKIIPVEIK